VTVSSRQSISSFGYGEVRIKAALALPKRKLPRYLEIIVRDPKEDMDIRYAAGRTAMGRTTTTDGGC
jgi:hypothetical protein